MHDLCQCFGNYHQFPSRFPCQSAKAVDNGQVCRLKTINRNVKTMAVFDTASKFVLQAGQSPGLALMMLMVFADYVAGDVTFHCPCDVTEYGWNSAQQYYAVTFLLSPGFTILVVDARWGLCRAWRNWRNSFIMLYRPLVLCTTWIFYFLASKRFSHCFDKTMACICDDEETKTGCTTSTKVHQAYIQLTVACMLWAILCFAMWATGACRRRGSKQERREFADTLEELVKFGLSPWTVVTLYEQGLIHEPKDHPLLLLSVEDEEVKRLPVTIGQLELVRQYRKIRQKQRQYADGVKGKKPDAPDGNDKDDSTREPLMSKSEEPSGKRLSWYGSVDNAPDRGAADDLNNNLERLV